MCPLGETTARIATGPKVSIGLPVFNGECYLSAAIDSLLAQTLEDFELIVCDNASTDGTEDICRRYASRDRRIRYARHARNIGAAQNFNAAFRLGTAPYVKWAAYDDLVHPTFLERCVAVLERDHSVVLAFARTQVIGPDGEYVVDSPGSLHLMQARPSDRLRHLFANLQLCDAQYGVIRRDVLGRTALFRNFVGADVCLLAELSLYGKFFELPDYLFSRRLHPAASRELNARDLAAFFDAGAIAGVTLREWRHLFAMFRTVLRAPVPGVEKALAFGLVARRAVWMRDVLGRELLQGTRQLVHRPRTEHGETR